MKKFLTKLWIGVQWVIVTILSVLIMDLLVPVVGTIGWLVMLPVKLVLLAIKKADKVIKTTDEIEEWFNTAGKYWYTHYTLTYLIIWLRYCFAMKFGFAL